MANEEGQPRRGAQLRREVNDEAVGGEHARGALGELAGAMTAIVRNGSAQRPGPGGVLCDVGGKTLSRPRDDRGVHAVGARAEDAAQAAGAELQRAPEAILQLLD